MYKRQVKVYVFMQKRKKRYISLTLWYTKVSPHLLVWTHPHPLAHYHAHYAGTHMQHPRQQKCMYTLVTQQDPGMQLDYISTCMCEDPYWALKRVVVIHLSRLFERDPTHTDSLLLNQGNIVYMHKNGISTAPLLIKELFSISLVNSLRVEKMLTCT